MPRPTSADPVPGGRPTGQPVIVHVAESYASGTASAIADFVRNYPEASHHLVYSFRKEARIDPSELTQFESAAPMPPGTIARVRFLRRYLTSADAPVIVHAHSSMAGAYVRLAVRRSLRRPVVYTPHCYSFERLDVPWPVRQAFRLVEWLLSFNTTAFGACSHREAALSRWAIRAPRVVQVPNVPGVPQRTPSDDRTTLRIVGNGRLGPQKDPGFFAAAFAAAAVAHPGIEAVWVGGGDEASVDLLRASGVEVTGWLPRHEALDVMAAGDLYLHTALWEGFPISIMEAVGLGLPVVARRRPYLDGVDMPVVIDEPGDLVGTITELRRDGTLDELRAASARALAGQSDADQRLALTDLYGPLIGRR